MIRNCLIFKAQNRFLMRNRARIIAILLVVALLVFFRFYDRSTPVPPQPATTGYTLKFSKHALCRMGCRQIDEAEVREILDRGEINYRKSEPDGKPDPKFAYEGRTHDGQEVRIVVARKPDVWVVVTVIDLGREWTCDCK
jgi:Domain of unknown function (DUF4258)